MTATEIMKEIRRLAPEDREQVRRFLEDIEDEPRLSAQALGHLAQELAAESDSAKVQTLKDRIERGFYGRR